MTDMRDLVLKNRARRRFYQEFPVARETLRDLVDLARCSASGANRQPLKYMLSYDPEKNARIFPCLGWAAALKDWHGPPEGERPAAYIVMLLDTEISKTVLCDHGIAAQSIMLGATEKGLGGCIHGSVNRNELSRFLGIPSRYEILLVLSLGKPREKVVLETLMPDGNHNYWRDSDSVHHVPKRRLDDIIIG